MLKYAMALLLVLINKPSFYSKTVTNPYISSIANETLVDFKYECIKRKNYHCILMLSSLKPIVIADVIIFDKEILGLYLPDDNSIIIKNNIINSLHIKLIMLHELGHMMGLVHEENTIMQAEGGLDDKHYAASLRQLFDLIEKEPK